METQQAPQPPQVKPSPQKLSWQQRVFAWSIKNQKIIFWLIRINYAIILGIFLMAAYSAFMIRDEYFSSTYVIGPNIGKVAIVLLGIVILPGILGRIGIQWQATRIITFFRRQLGITVFLLAFTHYGIVRLLPMLSEQVPFVFPYSIFEMFGFSAFCILFIMYATSNNWSMKKLGSWWKRMHRLIYVVLWLLVFHTGLQRISVWSIMIFAFAVLEVVSLFVDWNKKRQKSATQKAVNIST